MNVFILGGTGFLGFYTTRELLRRGHQVRTLALPPAPPEGLLPPEVEVQLGDFNELSDAAVMELFAGCEGVVFAAGADDRVTPKRPAQEFFHDANVVAARRFFNLASRAGVRRGVLLSSYFAHFDRIWPELRLSEHHPYIRSRREQEAAVLAAGDPQMDVMILELPYIFGGMPGRLPIWKPLVDYLHWPLPWVFYMKGGSAMVSVDHVAEAIAGALEQGQGGERYLIGDENLTWTAFLHRLMAAGGWDKPVVTLPNWLLWMGLGFVKGWHWLQGREGGLDPARFLSLQTRETFFDPRPAQKALGFTGGGLDEAFGETVRACGYALESDEVN
ncbi:NAD(P)H-binding protein [bacterium]|nr:NAD(P)H-binding protein [bacterium]